MDTTIPIRDAAFAPKNRRIMDEGGAGFTPYNAEHPDQRAALLTALAGIAVLAARMPATAWADGSVAKDMRAYKDAEIQVAGLAAGKTVTVTRSVDGTNYVTPNWLDQNNAGGTVITANGTYSFDGFGLLKWASDGTPTVTVRGSN
jgi:hypothetical protein